MSGNEEIEAKKAKEAFSALAEWIWLGDLPGRTNNPEGIFDLSDQVIGYGGTHRLDMLWDIAKGFNDKVYEESFITLLESTLSEQLAEYDLGFKWTWLSSGLESARVLHFYKKG